MKGTTAPIIPPLLLQCHMLRNHWHNVICIFYLFNQFSIEVSTHFLTSLNKLHCIYISTKDNVFPSMSRRFFLIYTFFICKIFMQFVHLPSGYEIGYYNLFCSQGLLLYFFSQLKTRRKKDHNCPLPHDVVRGVVIIVFFLLIFYKKFVLRSLYFNYFA